MNRRTFVAAAAVAAGMGIPRPTRPALGVQLYTLRRAMAVNPSRTLARVAAIGYREVEFAGYFGVAPAALRGLLAAHGLTAPAAHVDALDPAAWRAALAAAGVLGHRYLVLPWVPPERRRSLADIRGLAAACNRAGAEARAAGLRFAYHNQEYDLAPLEGRIPYDVLLGETDPALVELEIDVYWMIKGGHDPLAYFARWPGRIPALHLKDSAGPPAHRQADVGAGRIDFRAILAQRDRAGTRHFFVEHDEPADAFASIGASYAHLQRLEWP